MDILKSFDLQDLLEQVTFHIDKAGPILLERMPACPNINKTDLSWSYGPPATIFKSKYSAQFFMQTGGKCSNGVANTPFDKLLAALSKIRTSSVNHDRVHYMTMFLCKCAFHQSGKWPTCQIRGPLASSSIVFIDAARLVCTSVEKRTKTSLWKRRSHIASGSSLGHNYGKGADALEEIIKSSKRFTSYSQPVLLFSELRYNS